MLFGRRLLRAGRVAEGGEAGDAPPLCLERVRRQPLVREAARVGDVVRAAGDRAAGPGVDQIEDQRHVHADGRVQRRRRLPGAIAHAGHGLAGRAGGVQGDAPAIAGDDVTHLDQPAGLDLQPLDRRVDVAGGAAGAGLLAEHVPGLDRLPQIQGHAVGGDAAGEREAEVAVGPEPIGHERVAGAAQIVEHVLEVLLARSGGA